MKKIILPLMAVGYLLLMTGCISPPPPPTTIANIQDDAFSKNVTINGGTVHEFPSGILGSLFRNFFIRSWVDKKTGSVSHQLYVDITYDGEWKFFEWAADDTATSLNVVKIDSHVDNCHNGCSFEEILGIELDDATLRSRVNAGYPIKLSAKDGTAIFLKVAPEQIKAQLEAVDKYTSNKVQAIAPTLPPNQTPLGGKLRFGVSFVDVPPDLAKLMTLPDLKGALIIKIDAGTVAEKAGIQKGDVVVKFDDKVITSTKELQVAVAATPAGKTVPVKVIRALKELTLNAAF